MTAGAKKFTWKTAVTVLVPELIGAPAAAIGAVHCTEKVFPKQLDWLKKIISKHIVQPHLEWFEARGGSLRQAHEKYNQRKRDELLQQGFAVPEKTEAVATPKERADFISGILLKGAVAMTGDIAATFGLQYALNKALKAHVPVAKTAFTEAALHLGGIALMPSPLLAEFSESMRYGVVSKVLSKVFGMSKEKANDLAIPYTYITFPGQVASLASLAVAHNGRTH